MYSFGEGLPYVPPLYIPTERGAEFAGQFKPNEFALLHGSLNYIIDEKISGRADFRGNAGFGYSLGSNRPYLRLNYSHNQIVFDSLSIANSNSTSDGISFSVIQNSFAELIVLRVEHAFAGNNQPDRSQAFLNYRRLPGGDSFWDGSIVAQRDGLSNFGMTAESSIQRPLRGRNYYLLGLGFAYEDRQGNRSGEGVARFGIARRILQSGWSARLEARVPFPVGLDRSHLARTQIAVEFGHSLSWDSLESLPSVFGGPRLPKEFGIIEGIVTMENVGVGGTTVLVNGVPRAVTKSDGSFRTKKILAGTAIVTLDIRQLDPRYAVVGGFSRTVVVTSGLASRADFAIARFSFFQGSVVVCEGHKLVPLGGARITLKSKDFSKTVTTSYIGGFQFDDAPPGIYDVVIEPGSLTHDITPEMIPGFQMDLTEDVLGYVLKIHCEKK